MWYEYRLISPNYEANFTFLTYIGLEYDAYMSDNHTHENIIEEYFSFQLENGDSRGLLRSTPFS